MWYGFNVESRDLLSSILFFLNAVCCWLYVGMLSAFQYFINSHILKTDVHFVPIEAKMYKLIELVFNEFNWKAVMKHISKILTENVLNLSTNLQQFYN